MRRLRLFLGSLMHLAALGVIGCGEDADSESPQPAMRFEVDASVVDRKFLLQSAEGYTLVPGTRVSLSFTATTVSVYAGCNTIMGTFAVRDGMLIVSDLSSTAVGCPQARHAQDDWLEAFLGARPELVLAANELTLKTSNATLHWLDRVVADPDRALVGPSWTMDSFIWPDGTVASYRQKPTVVFAEDGSVKVTTPCNVGTGTYRTEAAQITLGDVSYTKAACVDQRDAEVERLVQAVMRNGTLTLKIEANELKLQRGNRGIIAHSP